MRCIPQETCFPKPSPLLTKLVWWRWLVIGTFAILQTSLDSILVHNHAKENLANIQTSWPHACQYLKISRLFWNPYFYSLTSANTFFPSSALNFIKTVRTSRQLPRTRPVDCGTCSQETVSDFSQDTRYLNNNNKHHMQRILCFVTKTWHRCRKVIIWRALYLAATKMVLLVVVFV